jgi:hypothetical protein
MLVGLMTAGLVLSFGSLPTRADSVNNGSFETPTVPTGSYTDFASGSTGITGWTVVGAAGGVSIVSGTFTQNGISFPAESGSQWLDLTGQGTNSTEGVEQSIATVSGTKYNASFWVGNVYNPGGIFGTTSTVDVYANGMLLGAFTNSSTTPGIQVWEQFFTTFTATGPTTTIEFLNADPANDNSNGLDNVTVNAAGGTPVPEPGTLSLVAAGLFGLLLRKVV